MMGRGTHVCLPQNSHPFSYTLPAKPLVFRPRDADVTRTMTRPQHKRSTWKGSVRHLNLCYLLTATLASSTFPIDIRRQACKEPGVNSTQLLNGVHLRVGLYSGELSDCNISRNASICARFGSVGGAQNKQQRIWTGSTVDEWYMFATEANFTFEIISLG